MLPYWYIIVSESLHNISIFSLYPTKVWSWWFQTAPFSRPTLLTLQLNGNDIPVDVAIVSPLTTERILGLDFLESQKASTKLKTEELLLRAEGITLLLQQSTQLPTCTVKIKAKVQRNISVPA